MKHINIRKDEIFMNHTVNFNKFLELWKIEWETYKRTRSDIYFWAYVSDEEKVAKI
jgi:hypothetical protein